MKGARIVHPHYRDRLNAQFSAYLQCPSFKQKKTVICKKNIYFYSHLGFRNEKSIKTGKKNNNLKNQTG